VPDTRPAVPDIEQESGMTRSSAGIPPEQDQGVPAEGIAAHLAVARSFADLAGFQPPSGRRAPAKKVVQRLVHFLSFRQTAVNMHLLSAIEALHDEVRKGGRGDGSGGPSLREAYARGVLDEIHTAQDSIEWFEKREIGNWSFRYEDMLEFWYSKLIPLLPGMIYDIGAHSGRHTRVFARLGRPVLAFEPVPQVREKLSSALGDAPAVSIRHEALTNRTGSGHFVVNLHALEESGIERRLYNDEAHARPTQIEVEYARLDDVHDPGADIAFVKIDTEGGEVDILRGGRVTLETHRPVISVEYGFPGYSRYGHDKRALLELAETLGYSVVDIFGFGLDETNYDACVDRFCWDYLLLPDDKPWIKAHVEALRLALAAHIDRYLEPS
jgi:FkbM family methyltransferase